MELIENIKKFKHVGLLEICEVIPDGWGGKQKDKIYKYVELGNVHERSYETQELRGWELPSRAKHKADVGDIFIGAVWGSVGKWVITGSEAKDGNLIVTNGFYRLKIKEDKREFLPDLIFSLSSEFYRVQMRALATGSDGLADVTEDDLTIVKIPILTDQTKRESIEMYINNLLDGQYSMRRIIEDSVKELYVGLDLPPRKTVFSQV